MVLPGGGSISGDVPMVRERPYSQTPYALVTGLAGFFVVVFPLSNAPGILP